MNTLEMTAAATVTNAEHGSTLVGAAVIGVVVLCLLIAAVWVFLRFRSTEPLFRAGVSDVRAEIFAAGVLRELRSEAGPGPLESNTDLAGAETSLRSEPAQLDSDVPALSETFSAAVGAFADAIRGLAVQAERAALTGDGPETARAAGVVAAFTAGLGALPMKEVLDSAAVPALDAGSGDLSSGRSTT